MPLPEKSSWHWLATSGAVMKMWFHTDATRPADAELMLTIAFSVFEAGPAPVGLRA